MNNDFTCGKCSDECSRSYDDGHEICTNSAYGCYIEGSFCKILDEDGETCLECTTPQIVMENGKCLHYGSFFDANGDAYACCKYNDEDDYIEMYEAIDGKCENPFLSGTTRAMVVSTFLITFLLI
ncbi:hypothetical protein QTN25_007759 [Entamoeba marina]